MNEKIDTQRVGRKIPRDQLAAYGLMLGSNNLIGVIRNFYLFAYLIDVFGLQLELYMLAGLLFLAYNALNDVLFGIYADKPRHKLGRRIPYIRYGSLFLILTNILIWFPWFGTFPGNAKKQISYRSYPHCQSRDPWKMGGISKSGPDNYTYPPWNNIPRIHRTVETISLCYYRKDNSPYNK